LDAVGQTPFLVELPRFELLGGEGTSHWPEATAVVLDNDFVGSATGGPGINPDPFNPLLINAPPS